MCVWDGSKCINDPQDCGWDLETWTICQTTITETNTNANIWIYNDDEVGHWSVYDLIADLIPNTFSYDGAIISGKLLDEVDNPIASEYHRHDVCDGYKNGFWDRNVKLEYSIDNGNSWTEITTVKAKTWPDDGSWLHAWSCVSGTDKLRASYTPTDPKDWYYESTSTEKFVSCS